MKQLGKLDIIPSFFFFAISVARPAFCLWRVSKGEQRASEGIDNSPGMTDTCPNLSEYNTTSEDLRAMDAALCSRVLLCILILCSVIFVSQARWDHFGGPPLPNRSFVSVWNWPTLPCQSKWNISLNLSSFDIVVDSGQSWHGEYMTIFTQGQLGLWPYYDKESGQAVNGGLPQVKIMV